MTNRIPVLTALLTLVLAGSALTGPAEGKKAQSTAIGAGATTGTTQSETTKETPVEDDSSYPDPNTIPYRSHKSLLAHLFSLPAKVWRLAWTPLGETVIWAEQNRIPQKVTDFFYLNDEKSAAIFPLISLGGNTGAGGGFSAFHGNLFGKRKIISLSALYSSGDNNSATLAYKDSSLFGSSFYFDATAEYFNDSEEKLYIAPGITQEQMDNSSIDANNSTTDDETSYKTREFGVLTNLGYAFNKQVSLGLVSSLSNAEIDRGDDDNAENFPTTIPGADAETGLFSVGGALTLNFRNGHPRVLSGPLLRFGYNYYREVNGDRFEFNRFTIEANQFIPIPFLAKNRRLAVRGLFEKLARNGEKEIPFYELSMLGDAANLRGFDQNRFRGRGLLLFNFEYRYPVWDLWDAVIFVDQGQVYDDISDIALGEFHTSYGTGLRFMSQKGFLMRIELARSSEQWRALFQIAPNF